MTEEPIGSPLGDAPTEAVDPTRRVTLPGVVIAPHDESVNGRASADSVVGGGTDADRTAIDGATVGAAEQTHDDGGADGDGDTSGDAVRRQDARLGYAKTVAGVLIAYAALRGLCMAIVLSWGYHLGIAPAHLFVRFDMSWYIDIAAHGYDKVLTYGPDGVPHTTNLAFFPLYPGMIRAVAEISPLSYVWAGLVVAWISALAAAWGLFAVGSRLYNRRVGILLAVLWAVLPYAIDETLGLTESLFTALAAWCFYALLKRRWLTAGVLCMISGLSRPTAVALMAAVGVAALIALLRREKPWWRPIVATVISPLGWLAYLVWVARRIHRTNGWFYIQEKAWLSSFDGGRYSLDMATKTLRAQQKTIEPYV
ncbi:MAG TPA: glycosyltransferase family 39 protein, partial [Micromonosporaceae bacterium]|nr:glycosyltransferase family 39 protein [Micromonosporaceae bacterium]